MSTEAPQAPAAPAVAEAIEATPQDDGKKVFVGNLSFKTTEEELRQLFQGQGAITEATVITRKYSKGSRSLGYAFVTFATESEAQAAISAMDKKEFDGRNINVEVAKPPQNTKRGNIAKEAAEAATADGEPVPPAAEGTAGRGRSGRRGRGRGRARSRRGRANARRAAPADGEADAAAADPEPALNGHAEGEAGEQPAGRGRGRGRGRAPRRVGPPEGEPSKTLVFVTNLPFSVDNDGLKTLFEAYKVKSAHVVTRKRGPVTGLSKGFGFVDFEDEAEQKKALESFGPKEVEGRQISIKVAIEPNEPVPSQNPAEVDPSSNTAPEAVPDVGSLSLNNSS